MTSANLDHSGFDSHFTCKARPHSYHSRALEKRSSSLSSQRGSTDDGGVMQGKGTSLSG